MYLWSSFIPDCIAVLPWAEIKIEYIFLRYLKLIKFNTYQKYFDNFTVQVLEYCNMSRQSIFYSISLFRLIMQIFLFTHFFGCLWIKIGMIQEYHLGKGWIVMLVDQNMQQNDFDSLYITSVYFIITTFSSVGYGDVYGDTLMEWTFQIILEMLGIIVFGYMIGTF